MALYRFGLKMLAGAVILILISVLIPFSAGCSGGGAGGAEQISASSQAQAESTQAEAEKKEGTFAVPEFRDALFHEGTAETDGVMYIDISAVSEGYVAAAGNSSSRLKFQVVKDDNTFNYDIASDGTPAVFPLQCGDGHYSFRIMENIVDSKYALAFEAGADVTLNSEFEPFLRPNAYSDYNEDSECVALAREFAAASDSASDLISQVYDYICSHVKYDVPKAESIQSGYMPVPDETLSSGMGICFDYASLAAAMLRSQGIPTKIIFGYVAPNDLYHAWNMFYTDETGWITVEFKVNEKDWTRLDLTFSANGSDSNFIGNGTNYTDVYEY